MRLQVDKEQMTQRAPFNNLRTINHKFEAVGMVCSTAM